MTKIIAATKAVKDQDHIPLIVRSIPQIADRSDAILSGSDEPFEELRRGVHFLTGAGVQAIAIACNTAHYWYDRLSASSEVPILHIADAVLSAVRDEDLPLGLMATSGTLTARIYHKRIGTQTGPLVVPETAVQREVDAAINTIKAGGLSRHSVESGVCHLTELGAKRVVLACTELPLAVRDSPIAAMCIDANQALALACIASATGCR